MNYYELSIKVNILSLIARNNDDQLISLYNDNEDYFKPNHVASAIRYGRYKFADFLLSKLKHKMEDKHYTFCAIQVSTKDDIEKMDMYLTLIKDKEKYIHHIFRSLIIRNLSNKRCIILLLSKYRTYIFNSKELAFAAGVFINALLKNLKQNKNKINFKLALLCYNRLKKVHPECTFKVDKRYCMQFNTILITNAIENKSKKCTK